MFKTELGNGIASNKVIVISTLVLAIGLALLMFFAGKY